MKAGIHPEYKDVVFQDISSDFAILTRSTIKSKETIKWEDGNEYPLVKVEVSSASHPFYTGKHKVLASGGRVDRFKNRYGKYGNSQIEEPRPSGGFFLPRIRLRSLSIKN
jgi:large subunit ribosomal protein L31